MTGEEILDLSMEDNDAGAETIRDYLKALLSSLWAEKEGFSGKRPMGNSGWEYDLYGTLVAHKVIRATIEEDEDGEVDIEIDCSSQRHADDLIHEAIDAL
jgi:hypothetical protein